MDNIVDLTPEEHYVAHQLLVKMYPDHSGLVWAALQMTGQPNGQRSNNKVYGWLRKRYQQVAKQRTGNKNGSYGRMWFHNSKTKKNIKCLPSETPPGFVKGRYNHWNPKKRIHNSTCDKCGNPTPNHRRKLCDQHLRDHLKDTDSIRQKAKDIGHCGKKKCSDAEVVQSIIDHNYNVKEAAASLGYSVNPKLCAHTSRRFNRIKTQIHNQTTAS